MSLTALYARADAGGWTATSPLPAAYDGHSMVYASGRLYQMGGISYSGGILDGVKVYSAPASDAGAVGAWAAEPALPEAVYYHTSAAVNGYVYVLGGFHYTDAAGIVLSNVVYRAAIKPDGSLGAWQADTPLPQPVFFPSAASWNGRIYVTGGWNGSALINSVYSAQVGADGSLGPWTAQKSLPQAVYTHAAVSDGTLYVLGGTVNGGADIQNTVYFAKINADGSLADWAATSPLPVPVSNHGAVVANGRVFVLGGWDGAEPIDAVDSSLVAPDGSLGGWSPETSLPRALYLHATAVSATQIFVSGGIDPTAIRAEVYSMPLPPPPEPSDVLPPRTSLASSGTVLGGMTFVPSGAPLPLASVDDRNVVGDGLGVGVAGTRWSLDGSSFTAYAAPIQVHTDGAHLLQFMSTDLLGHAEAVRASTIAVDGTAPVSTLTIGAPQAVLATGETIVGPATLLAASALDPVVNGAASGVALVLAGVDGAPLAASTAPFVLPAADGAHSVALKAVDNVGNAEAVHAVTVYRDGTSPVTALAYSSTPYASPTGPIYGASVLLSFTAYDPASNGTAAGVNRTEYALDGGSATVYAGAFGAPEGAHALSYRSFDNVGNVETASTAAFAVDSTPPQTTLTVAGGAALFGADVLTAASSLTLAATDPVSGGIASGVSRVVYSVDGGPDQVYAAPFRLAAGAHSVSYGAVDNAGNAETRHAAALSVGTFLADALAALDSVSLDGGASVTGSVRTNGAFSADGRSTVNGDVTAMTVSLTGRSEIAGATTRGQATLTVTSYDLAAAASRARASNADSALPAGALSGGALSLSGEDRLVLPAGDYYLTGLSLSGRARLSVSGRVNIFLHGPLTVSGDAALNGSGEADDLWLVADAGDDRLTGDSRSAFDLYAPLSAVVLSGEGEFAGRVLAKTASLSGRALLPSTSSLPPARHEPGEAEHERMPSARDDGGTACGARAEGRDEAVASSRLDGEAPRAGSSSPVLPPPPSVPSAAAPIGVPAARSVSSRMPSFTLGARAAFSAVGASSAAVRAADGTAVVIPQGAVTAGLGVTVSPADTTDSVDNARRAAVQASEGLVPAAPGVQYGPEGTRFAKPVTLELPYDPAHLPAGVAENDLAVRYWNPATSDWEKLASSVDTQNHVVRAQTSHFSLYQLFGGGGPASLGGAADAFGLRAAYVFPNPVRGVNQATIRIQPGLADSVEVRIYDVTGRQVHSSSDFKLSSTNDGNGLGLQDTYDHVWDVSGVGSGVYAYVITAKKAGQADIHASGRIGVVK